MISFLRRAGATHVAADRTGLDVSATLSVARAQRLFGTRLSSFRTATKSGVARFVAPESTTHLPGALAGDVTGVVGLDTQPLATTPAPAPQALSSAADGTSLHALSAADRSDIHLGSAYLPRDRHPGGLRAGARRPARSRPTST